MDLFAAFFCTAMSLRSPPTKIFGIVTNYAHPRTTPKPPKTKRASRSCRNALERCLKKPASGADGLRNRRCLWSRSPRPANLADLKAHKPPNGNVLAKLRDRLRNHLADHDALVLDIVLLVKAVFLVKLLHLPRGNFLDNVFRLPGRQRLRAVNIALCREHLRRHFLAPHVSWIERRDVHRNVVAKQLESFRARHKVRLAINLHEHADLPARVNIAAHEPFARLALRFLSRGSLSFLPQNLDSLVDHAVCFHERRAAIAEPRPGPLAQLLHKVRRYLHSLLLCAHLFFSSLIGNFLASAFVYKTARTESLGAGLRDFLPAQIV